MIKGLFLRPEHSRKPTPPPGWSLILLHQYCFVVCTEHSLSTHLFAHYVLLKKLGTWAVRPSRRVLRLLKDDDVLNCCCCRSAFLMLLDLDVWVRGKNSQHPEQHGSAERSRTGVTSCLSARALQPRHHAHLGSDNSLSWGLSCGMFSSIPNLSPLEASSKSPIVKTANIFRNCQMTPGGVA